MRKIEQFKRFEKRIPVQFQSDDYYNEDFQIEFYFQDGQRQRVYGFYDENSTYVIRYMPIHVGKYTYRTYAKQKELDGLTGEFECYEAAENNHGIVKVKKDVTVGGAFKDEEDAFHFSYLDGTSYHPFGTTIYAFIYQDESLQLETLETLKESGFNKVRICVFPKYYRYNEKEPIQTPYIKTSEGWSYDEFDPKFFQHLEKRIDDLDNLGIECDLILFHPYDRWGFASMSQTQDDRYLKYIISRLASFKNIWWALANEYDLMQAKSNQDWERFARIIQNYDPYDHLRSIHNCLQFYDHTRPWITHCSIQRIDLFKTSEEVDTWRELYHKPIVVDECAYEGNIDYGWGNITGEEMTRRFYEGVLRGGYLSHGETYCHPQDILWWSHGGRLHGTSPKRIAFLRKIVEEAKGDIAYLKRTPQNHAYLWDVTCGHVKDEQFFFYFGFMRPSFRTFKLPEGNVYQAEIIDTWDQTITPVAGEFHDEFTIDMPGKQYILVRFTKK